MRAAQLVAYEKDFQINTVEDPTIADPHDVIVKVAGAGFCRTDIHMWLGQFDAMQKGAGIDLPFTCGHETSGWVAEVGPGVTHVSVGDPVLLHPQSTCGFCRACRDGDDMHCTSALFPGLLVPGGFAEYVKTGARAVLPLPEGMDPVDVAPLGDAGLTAYRAVKKALPLAYPDSKAVVIGAGGLGHIGIQALRALSQAEIIVVDTSQEALDHAERWGADQTVLARPDGNHVAEVLEHTGGAGAQVVLDYVGEGGAQNEAVSMLAANGVDFLVGYGGTLNVEILTQALFPETSFVGTICGTYNDLAELVGLVRRGAVSLETTHYSLSSVNDALHALNDGRLVGRGVLVPGKE